eukprot:1452443-Lingulodinium_polyedra.AAC.1
MPAAPQSMPTPGRTIGAGVQGRGGPGTPGRARGRAGAAAAMAQRPGGPQRSQPPSGEATRLKPAARAG